MIEIIESERLFSIGERKKEIVDNTSAVCVVCVDLGLKRLLSRGIDKKCICPFSFATQAYPSE